MNRAARKGSLGIGVWHCLVRDPRLASGRHHCADEEMPDPSGAAPPSFCSRRLYQAM